MSTLCEGSKRKGTPSGVNVTITCVSCGGVGTSQSYTLLQGKMRRWKRLGDDWYCPRPHCRAKALKLSPMVPYDLIGNVRIVFDRFKAPFYAIFGCPLKQFWDDVQGFDRMTFDQDVVKSGEESMARVVSRKFGHRANALLRDLKQAENEALSNGARMP